LRGKGKVGFIILGHDETAAGFLIEPMNDAGAGNSADAAELTAAMMDERVDECVLFVTGGWVNDEAGRFVYHEQGVVFEKNIERDFLGLRFGWTGFRPFDLDLFASAGSVSGLDVAAIDANVAFFDEPLDGATRNCRKFSAKVSIEPAGGKRFFYC
jgi:hypothetical protein